jgi:predicted transcriptional regulator
MIESSIALDAIFGVLAGAIWRDILKRVSRGKHTISELAELYAMSLAAVAKHVGVLEKQDSLLSVEMARRKLFILNPRLSN